MTRKRLDDEHQHDWKPVEKNVLVYASTVYPSGQVKRSNVSGKDTLKQLVCECGATITSDLERLKV